MKRSYEISPEKQALFIDYCFKNGLMRPSWFIKFCIWMATLRNKDSKVYFRNLAVISPQTVKSFYKQVEDHYPNFDDEEKAKVEAFFVSSPWNL